VGECHAPETLYFAVASQSARAFLTSGGLGDPQHGVLLNCSSVRGKIVSFRDVLVAVCSRSLTIGAHNTDTLRSLHLTRRQRRRRGGQLMNQALMEILTLVVGISPLTEIMGLIGQMHLTHAAGCNENHSNLDSVAV